MSSWVVDGGGGVSSNQDGSGMIGSPVDMFDPFRDGETCMGGDGTCCGMITGVSLLGRDPQCFWFLIDPWCVSSSWRSGMGSSSVEDAGSGVSDCISM